MLIEPKQKPRVLALSKSFKGICQAELLGPDVVDGFKPITRLAARIEDLEKLGCTFEIIGWRKSTKVYRLVSEPDAEWPKGSIPLRARDGSVRAVTFVDEADFAEVGALRWSLTYSGYAGRKEGPRSSRRDIWLHREILGLDRNDPRFVDHIDGDKLNNRRANLRPVTHAENHQNRRLDPRNKSGFRGVSWHKGKKLWLARAQLNGCEHCLGFFAEIEDAARAASEFRAAHMPYSPDAAAQVSAEPESLFEVPPPRPHSPYEEAA